MNVYEVEELAWICAEDEQQAERVAQLERSFLLDPRVKEVRGLLD